MVFKRYFSLIFRINIFRYTKNLGPAKEKELVINARINSEKGFTLWELLIVLFLVGLLLGGVVPHYEGSREKTSEKINLTNIKLIEGAAQLYRLDTGVLPTTVDDLLLNPTGNRHWRGPYLDQWPKNPYSQNKTYEIDSLGKVN